MSVRQVSAYTVLAVFVVFFLYNGLAFVSLPSLSASSSHTFPDFSHYGPVPTLAAAQFPLDDPHRRTIIVGDIHGKYQPFQSLLAKLAYDPSTDALVHVGDILTKGSHNGSMATLAFMAAHNITGVRGNHDQKVLEWRAWIAWIRSQPGGPHWLDDLSARYNSNSNPDALLKPHIDSKWAKKIPKGWKLFSDHFNIARAMSDAQYAYLRALPLAVHVPSAHAYIVHAGLLPSDPRFPHNDPRQPLARVPHLTLKGKGGENTPALRELQEKALMVRVPQNTVPFNILNIRSFLKDKASKNKKGQAWSKIWRHDMERCAGFDLSLAPPHPKDELLPCYPISVIYGHAASRGLDVKRWSIGLDSGCVYNHRLSALVLGPAAGDGKKKPALVETPPSLRDASAGEYDYVLREEADDDDGDDDGTPDDKDQDQDQDAKHPDGEDAEPRVRFGDTYRGRIVSVSCG
ncbi:hypothetical protein H0H81_006257 [Sphagnurus paluster]|uniref:Calcineurin-like phosphoesterase domain-containing protein n=1 Tax=Sphagnurus paluster TaxID=117069 RepID=A0A9P7GRG5_9AGAR|nr:hypothetical protein H0H81_006257 [Sphagnurus paluster]